MAILAVGVLLALLAGCGGDDSPIEPVETTDADTAEQPSALSKRDFIAEVDPRCAEASVAIAGLGAGTATGNLALLATQEEQITKGLLQGIREVAPSEEGSGALDRYLKALQQQASISGQRAQAAESGETATYETLGGELAQVKADALAAASEYGFEDCGQEVVAIPGTSDGTGGGAVGPAPAPAPAPETPSGGGTSGGTGGGGGGGGGGEGGGSGGLSPG